MKNSSRQGLTLVELIIAMSLSSLLLGAIMSTFIAIARSSVRLKQYYDMEQATTRGLEQLGRELRMTQSITTSGEPITQVTIGIPSATGSSTSTIVYRFDTAARTFVRVADGRSTVLIHEIETGDATFGFKRFDLAQNPANNDHGTNQLQISMTLRHQTHGMVASTSKRVISSRFVLRNR